MSDLTTAAALRHRDGRLNALERLAIAEGIISEIHAWAVCGAIATPEDMMQNLPHIVEITKPNQQNET